MHVQVKPHPPFFSGLPEVIENTFPILTQPSKDCKRYSSEMSLSELIILHYDYQSFIPRYSL